MRVEADLSILVGILQRIRSGGSDDGVKMTLWRSPRRRFGNRDSISSNSRAYMWGPWPLVLTKFQPRPSKGRKAKEIPSSPPPREHLGLFCGKQKPFFCSRHHKQKHRTRKNSYDRGRLYVKPMKLYFFQYLFLPIPM